MDTVYKQLSLYSLEIFKSGFCHIVDKLAQNYHERIFKRINIVNFIHCEEECSPCKLVHNTNKCTSAKFLHVDSSHYTCETCIKVECSSCKSMYCRNCNIANPDRNTENCNPDIFATCKYCLRTFCTSCTEILCKHVKVHCQKCGIKHCKRGRGEPDIGHSAWCFFETCSTCNIEYCKICNRLCCTDCTCSVKTISPNHKQKDCKVPKCNCSKRNKRGCMNSCCGIIYDVIFKDHKHKEPNFFKIQPQQWQKSYWEVAKCFLSPNTKPSSSAEDTDVSGLISICINNTSINRRINNIGILEQVCILNNFRMLLRKSYQKNTKTSSAFKPLFFLMIFY